MWISEIFFFAFSQVSARTEMAMKRRSQATPSRTFSKRRSRFSSLWGIDTASRRKSRVQHPTISQVDLYKHAQIHPEERHVVVNLLIVYSKS